MNNEELIEKVADFIHDQWSHWEKHKKSKEKERRQFFSIPHRIKETIISFDKEDCERWERQMHTPYAELSEKEKDSDRKWAVKIIKLIEENTPEYDWSNWDQKGEDN